MTIALAAAFAALSFAPTDPAAPAGAAGRPAADLPFPLGPEPGSALLAPRPEVMDALAARRTARVGPLSTPAGADVVVVLERIADPFAGTRLVVDGEETAARPDAGLTLWRASVEGAAGSHGFLALSPLGSRGWFAAGDELVHLLAEPGPDGWSASRARLVSERELRAAGGAPSLDCRAGEVSSLAAPSAPLVPRGGGVAAAGPPLPLLECTIAVESDWQYYQLFGDLGAAQTYLASLFGAVSDRYREQVGTILTASVMGFWTTPADPWQSQDQGGNCIDVLYEFKNAWDGGAAPVPSNLYHLVSGADLGCGVAFLPGLCDPDYGFAVSGNVNGQVPFPVAQGPLNWDFMVFAHETGHNFASPHTHDYCPPLDECAPSGYFGSCQSSQVCTSQGTIMSYCHLCDGGLANITTYFHPTAADVMRSAAAASCLSPFEGVLTKDLGFALTGSGGTPQLSALYQTAGGRLTLATGGAPASAPGALVVSPNPPVLTPLFGGTLVPGLDIVGPLVADGGGDAGVTAPVVGTFPLGTFLWAQAWFLDGSGHAATNGLEVEVIKP